MKYRIPFIKPNFPKAEDLVEDYEAIIAANWFTNFGPFEQKFSLECARFVHDAAYATTISNCTQGLEAAVDLLFDKKKKKVIMPSFTFSAGAEVLIRQGFTPVLIDIDAATWQPDIRQAGQTLKLDQNNFAGILLCNIFGVGNKNVQAWEELSKKTGLPLIIDSAAGYGSQYFDDEMLGMRGDCEVFSMHATKPFAIGEGGLVVSRNKKLIDDIRSWQNFGFSTQRSVQMIGTNAKLQEVNAAIGLRQLTHFSERLKARRLTLAQYQDALSGYACEFQANDQLSTVPFTSVVFETEEKAARIYNALLTNGVEVKKYYSPLHAQDEIMKYAVVGDTLSVTDKIAGRILSLPTHDYMSKNDIDYIISTIVDALEERVL